LVETVQWTDALTDQIRQLNGVASAQRMTLQAPTTDNNNGELDQTNMQ
jgi:hypothetical protein